MAFALSAATAIKKGQGSGLNISILGSDLQTSSSCFRIYLFKCIFPSSIIVIIELVFVFFDDKSTTSTLFSISQAAFLCASRENTRKVDNAQLQKLASSVVWLGRGLRGYNCTLCFW